jgi:hypothetical protein
MCRIFGSQNYVKDSVIGYGLCVCSLYSVSTVTVKCKSKGTVNPVTCHEGTEGDLRYNSIALFFLQPRR